MNFTANSRRAAVLSLFSLLVVVTPGCIATDSSVNPKGLSDLNTSPDAVGETVAATLPNQANESQAAISTAALTSTRGVIDRSSDGLGLDISEGPGINQVSIQTTSANPEYKVQRLSDPPRIVIDLPSERARVNKNIQLADLEYISGVRVGAHPDKSRIVLDLAKDATVSDALGGEGKVVITLSGDAISAPLAQMKPEGAIGDIQPVNNTIADSSSNSMKESVKADSAQIEERNLLSELSTPAEGAEAKLPGAKDATTAAALPTEVKLNSVRLEAGVGASNMVVVDVEGQPEYSIEKTAPSEYVLTVKKAQMTSDAETATLMASPESTGIRSVRSRKAGDDAQIRIFAQPETYLTARMSAGKLVVEQTTDMAKVSEDMRAQLDPKGTADEPKKVEEKKAEGSAEAKPVVAKDASKGADEKAKVTVADGSSNSLSEGDLGSLLDDTSKYTGRLISLDLQDTDIDNALRIIAEVSNLNIVASDDVTGKVTLRLIDVPWDQALDVILKTNGLDKVLEGNVMRIAPVDKLRQERESLKQAQQAEEELESLSVKYLRVSYAKASELKTLVETVLSERGSVAYDERSNQLIIKDVKKGLKNVVELVNKIDLRTPQVLLETQIVEATRSLGRELGAELGFQLIQSPLTGNGTGLNFPAAISIGGSAITTTPGSVTGSSFPASSSAANGSAVTALFDSADGTKSLEARLSQLEQEGRVRIISRPAVATTNNKAAQIKSVEKVRVRLPNGGLSVATGSGASAAGSGSIATEVIEAGIILDVTPQASPDYFVLLDIKAKSSTFSSRESGDGIPNEIERSASSTVLISSGQTFALGGIYKISDTDRVSGVPFFKDIPVIGHLFRRSVIDNSDEELLFFITPRIVEGSFDDASMKSAS